MTICLGIRQNWCVLILYPDTNALHADLLLLKPHSKQLLEALLVGRVEIALSPVVLAEAQRQVLEAGQQTANEVKAGIASITRKFGVPTVGADAVIAELLGELQQASARALAPLLKHPACKVLPWPKVNSEELVMREINRLPPTRLKGTQSIGLRDTIIWHGLVALMSSLDENDEVLFLTSDDGFLQDGALAPLLIRELEDDFIDPEQLSVVSRLESAVVKVGERREHLTRQDGLIRQVVIDHLASFDGEPWLQVDVYGNAPLRYGIEEGVVSAVDSIAITETFENPDLDRSFKASTTVEATAEITVSGYMRSDEYMLEYSEAVEWTHGEISDPMIGVTTTGTIYLEAEVSVSDDGEDAWVEDETLSWGD